MNDDRLLSLLGLCKRAGRLSWGHDTCVAAVENGRARVFLLASDVSQRTKKDILRAAQEKGITIELLQTDYTMAQLQKATGCFAGILTTYDEGFASKIAELHYIQSGRNSV